MGSDSVNKKASKDILRRAKELNRHYDAVWRVASKSPMLCRSYKNKKTNKITKRSVRLINRHAYGVAGAGAVQAIAREQQIDCDALGIEFSRLNEKGVPIAEAMLTDGLKCLFEQVMCAYVQRCVTIATRVLAALPRRKRITDEIMSMAVEATNAQVFEGWGIAPRTVYVLPMAKKPKKKKRAAKHATEEKEGDEEAAAEKDKTFAPLPPSAAAMEFAKLP